MKQEIIDELNRLYPPTAPDVQKAINELCIGGHMNIALDDIYKSQNTMGGPDAVFNIIGSISRKAIEIYKEQNVTTI